MNDENISEVKQEYTKDDFEFTVEPHEDDDDYTHSLWMYEGTEDMIGEAKFEQLEHLFAKVTGVDEIMQEDREVFYINSKLTLQDLEEKLWQAFKQYIEKK
jgi:hypothetical protein